MLGQDKKLQIKRFIKYIIWFSINYKVRFLLSQSSKESILT